MRHFTELISCLMRYVLMFEAVLRFWLHKRRQAAVKTKQLVVFSHYKFSLLMFSSLFIPPKKPWDQEITKIPDWPRGKTVAGFFDCTLDVIVWIHILNSLESATTPTECYAASSGSSVVKVLCYKSESRWFVPSCCQIFH